MATNTDKPGNKEFRTLWAELGLPEPEFLDETGAPPVNRELIADLIRDDLPEAKARAVSRLIVLYKSWSDAHKALVDEQLRRTSSRN